MNVCNIGIELWNVDRMSVVLEDDVFPYTKKKTKNINIHLTIKI